MATHKNNLSPLMQQYYTIKNDHPDVLLLFQVGDFYELFFDDAKLAASFLGIALTQRGTSPAGEPIPLCGVPVHVLDHYVTKLVRGGFKVAICDQLEGIKQGKIIERGITQILTPGTLTDTNLLDEKSASYLCSFFLTQDLCVLIFTELLTGQLFITTLSDTSTQVLEAELSRFNPAEILVPATKLGLSLEPLLQRLGYIISREQFNPHANDALELTKQWFFGQFGQAAEVFSQSDALQYALVILYKYLKRNNERALSQLKQLFVYQQEDFLMLDAATQRNLELIKNIQDGTSTSTLFDIVDCAVTSMGSRVLKKWLLRPLVKRDLIEQRLDVVDCLLNDVPTKDELRKIIRSVGDLERVVGRIGLRRAHLHDYRTLIRSLACLPTIISLITPHESLNLISLIKSRITDFAELNDVLDVSINDDTSKDWLIKSSFSPELDRLRLLSQQGAQAIATLECKEQQNTGINSLKIRYNGAHGYGIEITKSNSSLVPSHYMRIQTLVNRERYTTQELKDLEYDILRARTDSNDIEKELFEEVKLKIERYLNPLKKLSQALSYLDALQSLAHVAYTYDYSRPEFNDSRDLIIIDGRHPVIEKRLGPKFIPNTVKLTDKETTWLVTGPNMGGKSTYLRQIALISIMAQMGSFVPARTANLALVDRVFTRIGAADNVAEGKSTFLVEMEETALICNQATRNSLVILDEVGRGTSTFDGLAIAQAVVEYIYRQVQARCLFATHYHELVALSSQFPGIVSYYASSSKATDGIILLHKILPGIADGSFGLEVARLAQLPPVLLERASALLEQLTQAERKTMVVEMPEISGDQKAEELLYLRQTCAKLDQRKQELEAYISQREKESVREKMVAAQVAELDIEQLTAKQALDILWRLKEQI